MRQSQDQSKGACVGSNLASNELIIKNTGWSPEEKTTSSALCESSDSSGLPLHTQMKIQ